MKLHNEDVEVGDRVYDISVKRGYGKVVLVRDNAIEVQFNRNSKVIFNTDGIQSGQDKATLFWERPLIIAPSKDDLKTSKKQAIVKNLFEFLDDSVKHLNG